MEKDLIVKYVNGAKSNLRRLSLQLEQSLEIPLQSSKVHGTECSISSTDARFLSNYLLEVAEEALRLSDELQAFTTDESSPLRNTL